MFWHGAIHVGIGLSSLGFPGRKTCATIGFGFSAMHKVVLWPAWVIMQLENGLHSHGGGLLDGPSHAIARYNFCRHVRRDKASMK